MVEIQHRATAGMKRHAELGFFACIANSCAAVVFTTFLVSVKGSE
jgi:hypothetical protein